jgi:hypothetical protein
MELRFGMGALMAKQTNQFELDLSVKKADPPSEPPKKPAPVVSLVDATTREIRQFSKDRVSVAGIFRSPKSRG